MTKITGGAIVRIQEARRRALAGQPSRATVDQRTWRAREMAAQGYGWEDIRVATGIPADECRQIALGGR